MKNHKIVDGRLLQTNKKWSQLKESQKTWIYEIAREEYDSFISGHQKQPRKHYKELVTDEVYARIEEKCIWIPYGEVKKSINKYIDRLNRRMSFDVANDGDVTVRKATPQERQSRNPAKKIDYAALDTDKKSKLHNEIKRQIVIYLKQTRSIPTEKARTSHIKAGLSAAFKKLSSPAKKRLAQNKDIVAYYDTILKELYDAYTAEQFIKDTCKEVKGKSC